MKKRCYFLLIPPAILSLWTIFQAYKKGVFSPRYIHEKCILRIVNQSEALIKDIMQENDKDNKLRDLALKESRKEKHETTRKMLKGNDESLKSKNITNCSKKGENLVGPLRIDKSIVSSMEQIEKSFSLDYGGWVEKGGAWRPRHCHAVTKVAIILPYRNRYEHLKIFLRHLHPILKTQLLDYRIFIVEQGGNTIFNRAILFNIGFKESQKFNNYKCFIFHDVDLLPEDDHNLYSCPSSPRHMCPGVDKFSYRILYNELFGGVEAMWKEHFEKVNGFSNKYWGWGGEDDDLYRRCNAKGLQLTRPSMVHGRYKMLREHHHVDKRKDKKRTRELLNGAVWRMKSDGLNSLKYNLLQIESQLLYTHIKVLVDPATV